ncbi:MAG TPA: GNAT family N-acyltransferase [Polyangiaceae bacterium]
MSTHYEFVIAKSAQDKQQAYRLRHEIFVRELGAFTASTREVEVDEFDARATHILAKCGDQVVGTCRVLPSMPTPSNDGSRFATPGEAHYDYEPFRRDGLPMVEVSRSSVLPEHRGSAVLGKLWKAAYACAKRLGATHFMSVVHVGHTDSLRDAQLVYALLARRGLLHPRYDLRPRGNESGPSAPRWPLFSDAERSAEDALRLPPVLRLFHRFGLRACGKPVFMPEIGRVGLAMLAGPDTFSAATIMFFEAHDASIKVD